MLKAQVAAAAGGEPRTLLKTVGITAGHSRVTDRSPLGWVDDDAMPRKAGVSAVAHVGGA